MEAYKFFNKNIAIWLYPPIMFIFNYTWVNREVFTILSILMMLDMVTGVAKTIVLWWKPTSERFIIGLISKCLLLLVPMVIGLIAKGAFQIDITMFVRWVLWALVLAEWYSVLQNIVSTVQKKEIKEYDAMTLVLTTILERVQDMLTNLAKKG